MGDIRVLRSGPLTGASRIARHLWRMCFSLFVATGSFFLGQADELPDAFRVWPVLLCARACAAALAPLLDGACETESAARNDREKPGYPDDHAGGWNTRIRLMKPILYIHIAAGILGLISGYIALFVGKGSRLHRKAGLIFVGAMSVVSVLGFYEAVSRNVAPAVNVTAALLTTYLIVTALVTVRPVGSGARWLLLGGMAIALGVGIANTAFVIQTLSGRPLHGIPVFPFIMFGSVAFLGLVGDMRVMMGGPFRGLPVWRGISGA